jgi:hypothetical protein
VAFWNNLSTRRWNLSKAWNLSLPEDAWYIIYLLFLIFIEIFKKFPVLVGPKLRHCHHKISYYPGLNISQFY